MNGVSSVGAASPTLTLVTRMRRIGVRRAVSLLPPSPKKTHPDSLESESTNQYPQDETPPHFLPQPAAASRDPRRGRARGVPGAAEGPATRIERSVRRAPVALMGSLMEEMTGYHRSRRRGLQVGVGRVRMGRSEGAFGLVEPPDNLSCCCCADSQSTLSEILMSG